MINNTTESTYPLDFRKEESQKLGELIKNRHSVILIGIKRVGINNFLRFYLSHPKIKETYINDNKKHLFIGIDLNDLIEREIPPFWVLTLKRIVDAALSSELNSQIKKDIEQDFSLAIQSNDQFLILDTIRSIILKLVQDNYLPTIFYIRFDRIRDCATPELMNNLRGLYEASSRKLTFVCTSFRDLEDFAPETFRTASLTLYATNVYVKPASLEDIKIVYNSEKERFNIALTKELEDYLFKLDGGYTQYLFLSLISLHHHQPEIKTKEDLYNFLTQDEEVTFQSEELWETLNEKEKQLIKKVISSQNIIAEDKKSAQYLYNSGFLNEDNRLFSPLFESYIKNSQQQANETTNTNGDLSKKELQLFNYLKERIDQVCGREEIIEAVWPDEEEIGVTDWAIDRLVSRLRSKLKSQNSNFEIQTVKTRGYRLLST